jgi:2-hydroxymuconate-semialdehyde hydrolase
MGGLIGRLRSDTAVAICAAWLAACSVTPLTQSSMRPSGLMSLSLADGQSLAYRVAGKIHTTAPILFIHGIPDSSDSWIPIAAELGRSHPVYAVDLAGYGYSERPEGYDVSLSAQANYLVDFIDQLKLERVILVGHDIGGGVAQIIAANHPQRVQHLVLINTVIHDHWPALEVRALRVPLLGHVALTLLERPIWDYVLHKGFFNDDMVTAAMVQRYQHWYQGSSGRRRLVRNARDLDSADLTALSDEIRALPTPTLILWGREDRFLDAEPAQQLCQSLKDCRFVFIDRAGHFVLDEQPRHVTSSIQQFLLKKHDSGS